MSFQDSATSMSIADNIKSSKTNPVIYSAVSKFFKYDGITIQEPVTIFKHILPSIESYIITVPVNEFNQTRPEYISKSIYGTTDLWWLILLLNNATNHRNLKSRNIKILDPTKTSVINQVINSYRSVLTENKANPPEVSDLTITPIRTLKREEQSVS